VQDWKITSDLLKIVDIIEPKFINHNEEPEAVDIMMETEFISKLYAFSTEKDYDRIFRYLCSCSEYASDTMETIKSYKTA
jgi:hypothetical protein